MYPVSWFRFLVGAVRHLHRYYYSGAMASHIIWQLDGRLKQADNKGISELHITGTLQEESIGDMWFPSQRGQWCGRSFRVMMSSWARSLARYWGTSGQWWYVRIMHSKTHSISHEIYTTAYMHNISHEIYTTAYAQYIPWNIHNRIGTYIAWNIHNRMHSMKYTQLYICTVYPMKYTQPYAQYHIYTTVYTQYIPWNIYNRICTIYPMKYTQPYKHIYRMKYTQSYICTYIPWNIHNRMHSIWHIHNRMYTVYPMKYTQPHSISYGPLARYVKLLSRVAYAPGMPGTFSPPPRVSDPDIHHGTCVTHVPWCMSGSLTSGFLGSRRWGKPSRRMRNPQFYVSGKRSMKYTQRYAQYIPRNIYTTVCTVYIPWNIHTVVLCVALLWLLKSCYSFTQSLTGHCMGSQFQGNSRAGYGKSTATKSQPSTNHAYF